MRQTKKPLPIGIEDFRKIRENAFYYVDKTGMISDLLYSQTEVTLFTRPRRFGKSLNMSMLEAFFSPESDKRIFGGLQITQETGLCEEYMGQHPVISISLKGIDAGNYKTARAMAVRLIREEANRRERELRTSPALSEADRKDLDNLLQLDMPDDVLCGSLQTLSSLLEKHTGKKVVVLIDEYDVPLARAHAHGYYDPMVQLIRNLFHAALKTNSSLQFAVLTGCMRISKESIFTGLNNLKILGVTDARSDEYFGFTDGEVRELLTYYGMPERYEEVREWYDGYRFGNTEVYCPWDVINYCDYARFNTDVYPENYWANSSGNDVVRRFIEKSGNATLRRELESLVNGEIVEKTIRQDLTYRDMYTSIDNIWSVLLTTGYLTQRGRNGNRLKLAIPNEEIRSIFTEQILELFREEVRGDGQTLGAFCDALQAGDAEAVEERLSAYLQKTISVRDTAVRKSMKEGFYHGILIGLLGVRDSWDVMSNEEAGDGYCDVMIRDEENRLGIVIEAKYAEDDNLEGACRRGLSQIEEKRYAAKLIEEKYSPVLKYGIAFRRKECRVLLVWEE